jgi:multimeric flavodoxin WrbA
MTQAKVYVVIYTVYHHVHKLAVEVQKGLESTGVATKMFQGKMSWFRKKRKSR